MDGLVKSKGKRMDIIVRTDSPLSAPMRKDINTIFIDFAEAAGVAGSVVFQANGNFVNIPLPRLADEPVEDLLV